MDDRATDGRDESGATPDGAGDAEDGAAPEVEDSATPETEDGAVPETEDGATSETEDGATSETEDGATSETEDDRRLWLVERTYTDKGLVSLVYATTDGEYAVQRQRSTNALRQGAGVTAAITADPESLQPVEDESTRERYADEAGRMADGHDPDEAV